MKFLKSRPLFILAAILLVGLSLRFYRLNNPIADWHSWRQADTSAVTRNFVKYGIDLLHPRYDDFTDVSGKGLYNPEGYRFVEFPVYNLVHYLFFRFLPFFSLEIWGRLTSALCAVVSAATLYFILRRRTSVPTALLTAFFYLFLPFNIYFTRVILPDPFMVTLYLLALNFIDLWYSSPRSLYFFLSAIFAALALLVKPVALFFLLPALWVFFKRWGFSALRRPLFYLYWGIAGIPLFLWRLWMQQYPQGIPANMWLLNGNKIRFKGAFFQWIFSERIGNLILGNWGIFPLSVGLISALNKFPYFGVWGLSALLYLFTFATGNVQHDYYQIPIIPVLSIYLALGLSHLWHSEKTFLGTWAKRGLALVSIAFALAFSWYDIRGYYQVNHWEIVHAGQAADKLLPQNARVVTPYLGDTAFLYQTNRPGFPYLYMPVKDMRDLYDVWYYISVNYDAETNTLMNKYTVLEKTPEYVIIKLEEPIRP